MARSRKILVFGAGGQLGRDLCDHLAGTWDVTGLTRQDCDITIPSAVMAAVEGYRPDIVINAAAWTDVDGCEEDGERAFAVNGAACGHLARACRTVGARLIGYSTDYVFDGTKGQPYVESDTPNPLNVYGRSKLAGEEAMLREHDDCLVLRISWLYGAHGKNFVKTMLRLAVKQEEARTSSDAVEPLRVVNDQVGSPTSTAAVVAQTEAVLRAELRGVVHAASHGHCSWYDFAVAVLSGLGRGVDIEPCSTEEFPRPAKRPAWSVLENERLRKAGLDRMPPWQEALARFLEAYRGVLV